MTGYVTNKIGVSLKSEAFIFFKGCILKLNIFSIEKINNLEIYGNLNSVDFTGDYEAGKKIGSLYSLLLQIAWKEKCH